MKYLVVIFAYAAVIYPLWVRFKDVTWSLNGDLSLILFPAFGLVAFAILWLHVISGVFEPWLRKHFDFDKFVSRTSLMVFICLILHPLLLLFYLDFGWSKLFLYGSEKYVWLGIVGWFLLITYDIGKALQKREFFARNWNVILLISTIGILLGFFHSLGLGGDLQS